MTLVQTRANGFGTPSLPQLLLTAMLRVLAERVLNVASTLQMIRRRDAVNATQPAPTVLPRETSDTNQETHAAQHRSPIALMLRSAAKLRVSKHAGVLTIVSHTAPSPSVSLAPQAIHLPLLRRWRTERGTSSTAAGGGGGSPRLRGETEGASHAHTGSGPKVRVPREGGGPILLSRQAREALRIPSRRSGSPPSRGTRRRESATA